jgi:catechol 2,3-dioxygenase
MPAGMRLGPVHLQVANLARSLDYYQRVIGLDVLERGDHAATLGIGSTKLPLVLLHEHPGATPVPRRGRLGLYHFAILLPDRIALGRFLRNLGQLGVPAGMADHLVSEALYLYDPDGLGIEIYADRPRAQWRSEDRQLVMASEPLDVDDLVGALDDEPWTGMPAGTKIGHIHFYVPDLARAEQFHHRGLGLNKMVWNYPGALFMAAGGYHHHVGVNTWAHGAQPAGPGDARLLEWTAIVPDAADLDGIARNLEATGVALRGEGSDRIVIDPFGTQLRLTTP